MQTLSHGFKKPQTGDKGSQFFPALEENIQQLNDHTHNGTNSSKLTASAVTAFTASVLAASWAATGSNGHYRQLLTLPAAFASMDDVKISFRDPTTHEQYFLKVEKVSATTYYAYCNAHKRYQRGLKHGKVR